MAGEIVNAHVPDEHRFLTRRLSRLFEMLAVTLLNNIDGALLSRRDHFGSGLTLGHLFMDLFKMEYDRNCLVIF